MTCIYSDCPMGGEQASSPETATCDRCQARWEADHRGAPRCKRVLTVVTSSELQTFRDCPYKHGLAYIEGLRPKVAPRALSFGSAVHAGLKAAIAEPNPMHAVLAGQVAAETMQHEWFAKLATADLSGDALEELASEAEASVKLARWMIEHYVEKFIEDWQYLVPLAIEAPFQLRAQNVRGARVAHLAYAGVWDLVAYDRRYGDIVTEDHKTTSGTVDAIDRRVELDPQIAGYVWAVRRALWHADPALGETSLRPTLNALLTAGGLRMGGTNSLTQAEYERIVSGKVATGRVIYNVLRKKLPSEPKFNQDGRVSVAAIDTFASKYEEALRVQESRGQPRTDKQIALVAQLEQRGDPFLSRREFHRSDDEIERWRRELFVDAQRVREAEADANFRTRNPGHCTMPWSMPCAYRRPCLDPMMTDGFVRVGERHAEVAEAQRGEREDDDEA